MPKFPKNTGFKLPGLSSRELNTPGGFRKDQGVEDVGYCDNTEFSMLPQGSSPLLLVKPEYYKTTYTKTNWPKGQGIPKIQLNNKKEDVEETVEITPRDVDLPPPPEITVDIPDIPVPPKIQSSKVFYTDLPEDQRDAAREYNLGEHGTHKTTELSQATGGRKGFDTSFDYTGDRDETMKKKRKKMGY